MRYFIEVAEQGSIVAAANTLFISPQGLSQAILQLEKELGVKLFQRTANRISITQAGEIAYESALKILSATEDLQANISTYQISTHLTQQKQLPIFVNHAANISIIPKILPQYHRLRPAIKLHLVERNAAEMFYDIPENSPSVFFFGLPDFKFRELEHLLHPLECRAMVRGRILTYMSIKSPLAHKSVITAEDCLRSPLVAYHADLQLLRDMFGKDTELNVLLHSLNFQLCRTIVSMDRYSMGFSNEFMDFFTPQSPTLISKPLEPASEMVFGCFAPPEAKDDPDVELFLSLIQKEMTAYHAALSQ